MDLKPIAAFCEYVARPMAEDCRLILEKAEALHIPVTAELIQKVTLWMLLTHIGLELIRLTCYLGVVWMVCHTVVRVL